MGSDHQGRRHGAAQNLRQVRGLEGVYRPPWAGSGVRHPFTRPIFHVNPSETASRKPTSCHRKNMHSGPELVVEMVVSSSSSNSSSSCCSRVVGSSCIGEQYCV